MASVTLKIKLKKLQTFCHILWVRLLHYSYLIDSHPVSLLILPPPAPVHTVNDCDFNTVSLCGWEVEGVQMRWQWGRGQLQRPGMKPPVDHTNSNISGNTSIRGKHCLQLNVIHLLPPTAVCTNKCYKAIALGPKSLSRTEGQ